MVPGHVGPGLRPDSRVLGKPPPPPSPPSPSPPPPSPPRAFQCHELIGLTNIKARSDKFCFDEIDDGHLDYHELKQISHAMEGSRFGGDMAKFLDVCNMIQIEHHTQKVKEARKMGFGGFQEACNRCPLVVHPIMRLQEAMQMRTLGADRWKRLRDDYGGDFHHEMTEAGLLMLGEKKELAYEKNDSSLSFRETAT